VLHLRTNLIVVSILLLAPFGLGLAQEDGSSAAIYLPTFDQQVQRVVSDDDEVVGIALAIIDGGQLIYQKTFGETAIRSGESVTANTVFRIGSVSKTFTGTLLADLARDGIIDLEAPISPNLFRINGDRQPSLIEVASHQTGLPPNAYDNDLEAEVDLNRIMSRLASVDLICPVGECHTYQNLTFAALGKVIEQATESTFEQVMQERIFGPLGMHTASIGVEDLVGSESWALPHRIDEVRNRRYVPGDPESPYDNVAPSAGVNASLQDMVAWAFANLGFNPALSTQTLASAHAWVTDTPTQDRALWRVRNRLEDTGYGLGWRNYVWEDRNLITHSGYIGGYGAQILLEPESGFAFIGLWNSDARSPWYLWPTLLELQQRGTTGNWMDDYGFPEDD
jgi:beta-lactamase class C